MTTGLIYENEKDDTQEVVYQLVYAKYALSQRIIMVVLFLVVVAFFICLGSLYNKELMTGPIDGLSWYKVFALLTLVPFAFFYCHADGCWISSWGYYLLESIFMGNLEIMLPISKMFSL